jgi:hypothetical protein
MKRPVGRPSQGLTNILLGLPTELLADLRKVTSNVSEWLREAAQEKLDRERKKPRKTKD